MYITVFTTVIFRRYLFNLLLKDIELTFFSHIFLKMFQGYKAGLGICCDFIYQREKVDQILNSDCTGTQKFWNMELQYFRVTYA